MTESERVSKEELEAGLKEDPIVFSRTLENGDCETVSIVIKDGQPIVKIIEVVPASKKKEVMDAQSSIERYMFGKWTLGIRNFLGMVATICICASSIYYSFIVHQAIKAGGVWPDNLTMIVMNIGPIIIAWSVFNVNGIIKAILGDKETGGSFRERLAKWINPKA